LAILCKRIKALRRSQPCWQMGCDGVLLCLRCGGNAAQQGHQKLVSVDFYGECIGLRQHERWIEVSSADERV
jgi:hypothetical protein